MGDTAEYIVLCEDLQAQTFVYRALRRSGVGVRQIRKLPLPSKTEGGAGDAFVVAKYAAEVKSFRARAAAKGLVVHIDADMNSVASRHARLADALREAGQKARGKTEPIAELVPKRNIETWIYALDTSLAARLDRSLDEETDYRKLSGHQRDCATAAAALADGAKRGTLPESPTATPSLADGLQEFGRVLP